MKVKPDFLRGLRRFVVYRTDLRCLLISL